MDVVFVLVFLAFWIFGLLTLAPIVGRFCGLNDRTPPPRRWVDEREVRR